LGATLRRCDHIAREPRALETLQNVNDSFQELI
jgi:hypothetical protein